MKERKLGIIGRKVGMTQIFQENGDALGVTVLELGPCLVVGKKTTAKDGYNALQLGFGNIDAKKLNRSEVGHFKAAGATEQVKRFLWEVRVSEATLQAYQIGNLVHLKDIGLQIGDLVDASGMSKGKGFQGVMKRHHFGGFRATHGTHEYFRHGGSIGCRKWPGRVFKGRKMPGRMGNERVTTQNIQVVQIREEDNVLLLHGSVPGGKNGLILIRPAIKYNPHP